MVRNKEASRGESISGRIGPLETPLLGENWDGQTSKSPTHMSYTQIWGQKGVSQSQVRSREMDFAAVTELYLIYLKNKIDIHYLRRNFLICLVFSSQK